MNRHFSKEEYKWQQVHEKVFNVSEKCKSRLQWDHQISSRIVVINETRDNHWQGCGEKGTLMHCWWKCKLVQPLWKTVWMCLKNLQIELPYDSEMSFLIIHQKELKTRYHRPICTPCSLQHYSQWPRHGNKLIIYQKLNGLNNQRHWNKEQTDSNQRGGGREITGKERKRSSRNVCKWSMDKAQGGRNEGERWGWVGRGKVVVAKWRQLYLNNNF